MTNPPNSARADATPLSPERWAHVRALVEDALALPGEARPAFLDAACGDDRALRRRVERLVAGCERADGSWAFLARPAGELAAPLLAAAADVHSEPGDVVARLGTALAERYRIDRELGHGGMATVYLAHDLRHGRRVAIKVLHPEISAVLGAERFLGEIRTTAALQHPHILPLFDSGAADGLLFYVMPLVEGETLRGRLTREKQLPVADAVRIASEVAGALDHAHRRGVVHRDIKPENILLHEGRPLVADFGIALAVQEAGGRRSTRPGLSLGTPQYMSPEQATGRQEVTARSDVYALGAVTYEMLTGEPPFSGATVQQVVALLLAEEPRAITARRKHVTAHVEAAVLTALEKLPADRFESAGAFARALSEPGFGGAAPARAAGPVRRAERRPRRVIVAAAGAVALAGAAAWAWSRTAAAPARVVRFAVALPRDLSVVPPTALGASIAVSPDGRVVVFAGIAADGTRRLYARALDEAVPRALVGTDGGSQPFYSPDGRWIGFWSGERLQKVAAEGGRPRTVTATPEVVGATWLRDDVIVYSSGNNLYSVPSAGGAPTLMAGPESAAGGQGPIYPVALADGDHVLYSSWGRGGIEGATIGLASLSARSGKSLGVFGTNAVGVVDGRLIYATLDNTLMAVPFDASAGRVTGTPVPVATDVSVTAVASAKAALSRSGTLAYLSGARESRMLLTNGVGTPQAVLTEPRAYGYPRFSPDGRRIAVSVGTATGSDVVLYELGSRTPIRLSPSGSVNERPEWTPDGTRVLYRSDADVHSSIWWRAADLSGPAAAVLVGGRTAFYEGVITPDGRAIVSQEDSGELPNIVVRALAGDTTPRVVAGSKYLETQARVSPDGRWIAFVTDESGSDQVVVHPFPGPGARVQVSSNGGTEPVWARDGRRLFYRANKKFMVATVTTTPTFAVASRDVFVDDTFVPAASPHANYDVSPDGRRLLVLEASEGAQLFVVHNWGAEVRARLSGRVPPH